MLHERDAMERELITGQTAGGKTGNNKRAPRNCWDQPKNIAAQT